MRVEEDGLVAKELVELTTKKIAKMANFMLYILLKQ